MTEKKHMKRITLSVVIEKQTEKAYKIHHGPTTTWIPKSQVKSKTRLESDNKNEHFYAIVIPEWLAVKNGLAPNES